MHQAAGQPERGSQVKGRGRAPDGGLDAGDTLSDAEAGSTKSPNRADQCRRKQADPASTGHGRLVATPSLHADFAPNGDQSPEPDGKGRLDAAAVQGLCQRISRLCPEVAQGASGLPDPEIRALERVLCKAASARAVPNFRDRFFVALAD